MFTFAQGWCAGFACLADSQQAINRGVQNEARDPLKSHKGWISSGSFLDSLLAKLLPVVASMILHGPEHSLPSRKRVHRAVARSDADDSGQLDFNEIHRVSQPSWPT